MAAGEYNFTIEQGATLDRTFIYKDGDGDPLDLTGFTARMHLRSRASAATTLLELTTTNGRIVITGATGTIRLVAPASVTAALNFNTAVYDLEIESAVGTVTRLLQGTIELSKEVTR